MGLVGKAFMDLNLMMKTLKLSTVTKVYYQWQIQERIPMVHNFSLHSQTLLG